jgi:hypothetical protein
VLGNATGYGRIGGEHFSMGAGTDLAPLPKGLEIEGEIGVDYQERRQETEFRRRKPSGG